MKAAVVRAFGLFASVMVNPHATSMTSSWVDVTASFYFSCYRACPIYQSWYSQISSPAAFAFDQFASAVYDLSDGRAVAVCQASCGDSWGPSSADVQGSFEMTLESTDVLWIYVWSGPEGSTSLSVRCLTTGSVLSSRSAQSSSSGDPCSNDGYWRTGASLTEGFRLPSGRYRIEVSSSGGGYEGPCGTGSASSGTEIRFATCPLDLDRNGYVSLSDLSLMLLQFGPCPYCPADLDESGAVETSDIALLLLDFGSCPVEP